MKGYLASPRSQYGPSKMPHPLNAPLYTCRFESAMKGCLCRWLLHDPNMVLRSNYPGYTKAVRRYFQQVFEIVAPLQWAYGGPVIGFQVENEYASWTNASTGLSHMQFLYNVCTVTCTYIHVYIIMCTWSLRYTAVHFNSIYVYIRNYAYGRHTKLI